MNTYLHVLRRVTRPVVFRRALLCALLGFGGALVACDEIFEPAVPEASGDAAGTGADAADQPSRPGAGQTADPSSRPPGPAPDDPGEGAGAERSGEDPFLLLSPAERELYELIMAYRSEHDLPPIALSPALTTVAQLHVADLEEHGEEVLAGECNLHSWSAHGDWSPCCYTPDHQAASCMWNKPRELTHYTDNGYEISVWGTGGLTPSRALNSWQGSPGHNNVILNRDIWSTPWAAIGVGLGEAYGHVWFGRAADPMGGFP